jgi:hypothetical protein
MPLHANAPTTHTEGIPWPHVSMHLQRFHPVELAEELIDHPISDPSRILATPRGDRLKLVKEEYTWSACRRPLKELTHLRPRDTHTGKQDCLLDRSTI